MYLLQTFVEHNVTHEIIIIIVKRLAQRHNKQNHLAGHTRGQAKVVIGERCQRHRLCPNRQSC